MFITCKRALTDRQLICQRTSSRIGCSVGIQRCVCFPCCRWARAWQSDVWSYRRLKEQKKKKNRLHKGLCFLGILMVTVTNFTYPPTILNFTLPVCSSVMFTILMLLMPFNAKIILLLWNKYLSALLWFVMLHSYSGMLIIYIVAVLSSTNSHTQNVITSKIYSKTNRSILRILSWVQSRSCDERFTPFHGIIFFFFASFLKCFYCPVRNDKRCTFINIAY